MERLPNVKGSSKGRLPLPGDKPDPVDPHPLSGSRPDSTGRRVLSDWKGSFVGSPSGATAANPDRKEQEKALDNLFGAPLAPAGVAPIIPIPEPVRAPEPQSSPEPASVPEPLEVEPASVPGPLEVASAE